MHRLGAKVLASELLLSVMVAIPKCKQPNADKNDRDRRRLVVICNLSLPHLDSRKQSHACYCRMSGVTFNTKHPALCMKAVQMSGDIDMHACLPALRCSQNSKCKHANTQSAATSAFSFAR